ncbi:MAG: DNA polymerase I [Chthonomonadales bacterium]
MDAPASKPRLFLVDGYSLLFRAFFAPGPYLSTANGVPTGAVYGFTQGLLSIIAQEKPEALYVAWDAPGPTFRHETFAEYKAHRPEAGPDLKEQLPIARRVVEALGIASVEVPGYEADDLIGALARQGRREGYEVVIVTGDSDQLQLVGDGVTVWMTRKGVSDLAAYDEEAVRKRYGIPPERIPDFKALVGDASDNIPGVPGVGEKTASELLARYGSLENLLEHLHELPAEKRMGRVRESLSAYAEQARASKALATIRCDAPIPPAIVPYNPTADTWARARAVFEELEFRSLLRRIPQPTDTGPEPEGERTSFVVDMRMVQSEEELRAALDAATRAGAVAVALHTDGRRPTEATLLGIAVSFEEGIAYYTRVCGEQREGQERLGSGEFEANLEAFAPLFQDGSVSRVAHDAKKHQVALEWRGLRVGDWAFDTMVAAYLLAPGRSGYALEDVAAEHMGVRLDAPEEASAERSAAREAALALALWKPLQQKLDALGLAEIMARAETPLIPVLARMERTGVPVDREWLGILSDRLGREVQRVAARIYELAGEEFNIGSTRQLQQILFEKLKLPAGKKTATGYSTSADLLEVLAQDHEICARILEYRELSKLKSTYADALPKLIHPATGRLHTSFNQTGTATGRLSSSDPNLQNIPVRSEIGREIRKAFIAPPGQVLLSCDYSQIELRIFAHITRDAELMRAFAADEDIHTATAMKLFNVPADQVTPEMRRRAKTVNFAVIYGQSDFGLATTLGIPNQEASAFIKDYFSKFPGVLQYKEQVLEAARTQGYVQTLMGRRRYLPEINSGNFNIRQRAERAAVNMPVQGTAADIMKLAMIEVHRYLEQSAGSCALLLQVHDELVLAVPQADARSVAAEVIRLMENAYPLAVRLRVDAKVGPNWAEMAPIDA